MNAYINVEYNKDSPEYVSNGVYYIAGITWSTLWAYKKIKPYFSTMNTPTINSNHSILMTKMGYPSINTIPDIGSYEQVKAFPIISIEFFLNDINTVL
ncbi:hypothetical protein [Aeromonas allosaccharophila]|uniref:hypothetical protein n=1 Tax=Aeromonas allosaccharophila TaxID=656 RepID=UPI0030062DFA